MPDSVKRRMDIIWNWKSEISTGYNRLSKALSKVKGDILELSKINKDNSKTYLQASKALEILQKTMIEMTATAKSQSKEIKKLTTQLIRLKAEKTALSRKVTGLKTRVTNLKIKFEELRRENVSYRKTISGLNSQLTKQQSVIERLQKRVDYLVRSTSKQNSMIRKLHSEVNRLNSISKKGIIVTEKQAKSTSLLAKAYKKVNSEQKSYDIWAGRIRGRTEGLRRTIGALRNQILLFFFAFGGIIETFRKSIAASTELENSLIGLRAVTDKVGASYLKARGFAEDFTKSGLITMQTVAAGLKNLLSAGFGMKEAIDLLKAGANAAAFNRQGTLSLSEAIIGYTQGLKNQNSIMVDNAGITKNLSIMYKEYAKTIGKTAMTLTEAEKRQAIYNGVMKEASIYQGNLDLLAKSYSGKLEKMKQANFMMMASLGDLLKKGLSPLISQFTEGINKVKEWIKTNELFIRTNITGSIMMAQESLKVMVKVAKEGASVIYGLAKAFTFGQISIKSTVATLLSFYISMKLIGKITLLVSKFNFTVGRSGKYFLIAIKGSKALGASLSVLGRIALGLKGILISLGGVWGIITKVATVLLTALVFKWYKAREVQAKLIESQKMLLEKIRETTKARVDESEALESSIQERLRSLTLTDKERKSLEKLLKIQHEVSVFRRGEEGIARVKDQIKEIYELSAKQAKAIAPKMVKDFQLKLRLAPEDIQKDLPSLKSELNTIYTVLDKIQTVKIKPFSKEDFNIDKLKAQINNLKDITEAVDRFTNMSTKGKEEEVKKLEEIIAKQSQNFDELNKQYDTARVKQEEINALYDKRDKQLRRIGKSIESSTAKSDITLKRRREDINAEIKDIKRILKLRDEELSKNQKILAIYQYILGKSKEIGNQTEEELKNQGKVKGSLRSIRQIIESLKGKLAGVRLIGLSKDINQFNLYISKLKISIEEISKTFKNNPLGKELVNKAKDLLNQWKEIGLEDLIDQKTRGLEEKLLTLRSRLGESLSPQTVKGVFTFKLGISYDDSGYLKAKKDLANLRNQMRETTLEIEGLKKELDNPNISDENKEKMKNYLKLLEEEYKILDKLQKDPSKYIQAQLDGLKKISDEYLKMNKVRVFTLPFGKDYQEKLDQITNETDKSLAKQLNDFLNFSKIQQDLIDQNSNYKVEAERKVNEAYQNFEEYKTKLMEVEAEKRASIIKGEIEGFVNGIEQIMGGWQSLGSTIYEYTQGYERAQEEKINRQKELLDRGKITEEEYLDRIKQIEEATQKDREQMRAKFISNMIKQSSQIISRYLIEAGASMIATKAAQAQQSTAWATFFAKQASIMSINPLTMPLAANFAAQSAAETSMGIGSLATGAGLMAAGAIIGIAGGYAASKMEAEHPGSSGGFLGTPVEDVYGDKKQRLGGSIKAQEVHLSINPVTYINAGGDIYIGEGITVDTFKGLVNEAFINRAQEAIETGELELDSIITKEG